MDANPFQGQLAQWGALGMLVSLLGFMSLTLWRALQAERAAREAARDKREAEDRADRKEEVAANMALATALNGLRDVVVGKAKP